MSRGVQRGGRSILRHGRPLSAPDRQTLRRRWSFSRVTACVVWNPDRRRSFTVYGNEAGFGHLLDLGCGFERCLVLGCGWVWRMAEISGLVCGVERLLVLGCGWYSGFAEIGGLLDLGVWGLGLNVVWLLSSGLVWGTAGI